MSNSSGRLIVISGPTASGKSSLWRRLVVHPRLDFSVSATTRLQRDGEVNGRDYQFLTPEEFDIFVVQGAFLEHAIVHGKRYGTFRSEVENSLSLGRDIVLEIDIQGAAHLTSCELPSVSIFVAPPSLEVLRNRLMHRGTEDVQEQNRRLAIVSEEMESSSLYDHVVVNDDLDRMVKEVKVILGLGD